MAEVGHADAGNEIEVAPAVAGIKPGAFGPFDFEADWAGRGLADIAQEIGAQIIHRRPPSVSKSARRHAPMRAAATAACRARTGMRRRTRPAACARDRAGRPGPRARNPQGVPRRAPTAARNSVRTIQRADPHRAAQRGRLKVSLGVEDHRPGQILSFPQRHRRAADCAPSRVFAHPSRRNGIGGGGSRRRRHPARQRVHLARQQPGKGLRVVRGGLDKNMMERKTSALIEQRRRRGPQRRHGLRIAFRKPPRAQSTRRLAGCRNRPASDPANAASAAIVSSSPKAATRSHTRTSAAVDSRSSRFHTATSHPRRYAGVDRGQGALKFGEEKRLRAGGLDDYRGAAD